MATSASVSAVAPPAGVVVSLVVTVGFGFKVIVGVEPEQLPMVLLCGGSEFTTVTSLVTTPLVVVTVRVSVVMMSRMRFCPFLLQLQVSGRPCPQIDCVSVVVMTFLIRMFGEPSKVTVVARSTMGEVDRKSTRLNSSHLGI